MCELYIQILITSYYHFIRVKVFLIILNYKIKKENIKNNWLKWILILCLYKKNEKGKNEKS